MCHTLSQLRLAVPLRAVTLGGDPSEQDAWVSARPVLMPYCTKLWKIQC